MEAPPAEAVGDELGGSSVWSATTNWIEAEGSLHDSITFDTSENIENDQEAKPLLILRPEGDDPPPCEITIRFREKHEIYRAYVRSTARIYEIYYSYNHQESSNEYLCTVRCGAAIEEAIRESVKSGSNNSDEDSRVQIPALDTLQQDDKERAESKKRDSRIDSPTMQIHYEATAEISDSTPCLSLTLRLLSIQTKDCVHVAEIYVYADPVESDRSNPPTNMGESSGASSLFAMLLPNLMQLSKSGISREKCFSNDARVPNDQYVTETTAQTVSSDAGSTVAQDASSSKPPDQKYGPGQEPTEVKAVLPNSLADQHSYQAYSCLEKVLDDLVLKVGRVEAFCSKFEENMLNPLSCMDKRLQQMEQKLDALAVKSQSCEHCLCLRAAASESNERDPKNKGANTKHPELTQDEEKASEQLLRSRIASLDSNDYNSKSKGGNSELMEPRDDTTFIAPASSVDEVAPYALESQAHPVLVINAPEFLNEDDDCSSTEDTLDPLSEDLSKNKKFSSIDSALASSLAAFMSSASVESPKPVSNPTNIRQESVNGNNTAFNSLIKGPSEESGDLFDKDAIEDDGYDDSLSRDAIIVGECTAFDDPFSEDYADVSSPIRASQEDSGSTVIPPEFLNPYRSSNCDGTFNSSELAADEDQELKATVEQTVPPLAKFLYSRMVKSSSIFSNELPASNIDVPGEGDNESRIESRQESVMKHDVNLDPTLSMSPLAVGFEQEKTDGLDNDTEKAILHGCDNEDSSNPDFHEILEKQIAQTEWEFGCNSDSNIDIAGCSLESSNKGHEDILSDVTFTSEGNWTSGLPLEYLLGETSDANNPNMPEASTTGVDDDGIATVEQLQNSSATLIIDLEPDADENCHSEI